MRPGGDFRAGRFALWSPIARLNSERWHVLSFEIPVFRVEPRLPLSTITKISHLAYTPKKLEPREMFRFKLRRLLSYVYPNHLCVDLFRPSAESFAADRANTTANCRDNRPFRTRCGSALDPIQRNAGRSGIQARRFDGRRICHL